MAVPPFKVTMIRCSTLLLEWGEVRFLTDPWFGMVMRILPVWRKPGIAAEDLPPLDALLVSHLHADHWDEAAIDRKFRFTTLVDPAERAYILRHVLTHFFNHQTHHRGQLTTLISQAGFEPGVTDLMWLPGVEK